MSKIMLHQCYSWVLCGLLGLAALNSSARPSTVMEPIALAYALESFEGLISMRYTPEVQAQVDKYLIRNPRLTQVIADRAMRYFPVIDKLLEEHDLPHDLKYMVIVESGLNPEARSRAGAVGLWQFMAPTARDYKLRMYHSVDERMDPYRSTEAALKYIQYLYGRFGDWALVMAAYNTGPNRLARLMEEHGSNDFWTLRPHLPEETANYVPYYIAASYVFGQMKQHGITPARQHPDLHFTDRIEIFDHKLYLRDVADLLHIDRKLLYELNPKYKKNYIPKSENGYALTIPKRAMPWAQLMMDTLNQVDRIILRELVDSDYALHPMPDSLHRAYVQVDFILPDTMTTREVSELLDVDVHQLRMWNMFEQDHHLPSDEIHIPIPIVGGRFRMVDYISIAVAQRISGTGQTIVLDMDAPLCHLAQHTLDKQLDRLLYSRAHSPAYFIKGLPLTYYLSAEACSSPVANEVILPGHEVTRQSTLSGHPDHQ